MYKYIFHVLYIPESHVFLSTHFSSFFFSGAYPFCLLVTVILLFSFVQNVSNILTIVHLYIYASSSIVRKHYTGILIGWGVFILLYFFYYYLFILCSSLSFIEYLNILFFYRVLCVLLLGHSHFISSHYSLHFITIKLLDHVISF